MRIVLFLLIVTFLRRRNYLCNCVVGSSGYARQLRTGHVLVGEVNVQHR